MMSLSNMVIVKSNRCCFQDQTGLEKQYWKTAFIEWIFIGWQSQMKVLQKQQMSNSEDKNKQ